MGSTIAQPLSSKTFRNQVIELSPLNSGSRENKVTVAQFIKYRDNSDLLAIHLLQSIFDKLQPMIGQNVASVDSKNQQSRFEDSWPQEADLRHVSMEDSSTRSDQP